MILGIGTDMIEVERVKNGLTKPEFKTKVFSPREIEYCDTDKMNESYAVRYAAKEAFFKALGTGWTGNMLLSEVEILNDESGKPEIHLSGNTLTYFESKGGGKIHVSLSHLKEMAIAFVVIELH
jgi:holo-[acyl-carrier protein] synthase